MDKDEIIKQAGTIIIEFAKYVSENQWVHLRDSNWMQAGTHAKSTNAELLEMYLKNLKDD